MAGSTWRISYNAPFTLTFSLLSVLAFLAGSFSDGIATAWFFSVSSDMSWIEPRTYFRLIFHVCGHISGHHLVSNLLIILLLGPLLEEKYGAGALLRMALTTALLTSAVMVFIVPGTLLGASGVAFAFIVLSSMTRVRSGEIPLTFIIVALLFLGREIAAALTQDDQTAQFAHLLGGAVGAVTGWHPGNRK